MTNYIKNGNTFIVTPDSAIDIRKKLPVGNYLVKFNPISGEYYLEEMSDFILPEKFYGNICDRSDRIINTFNSRTESTGVLMVGEKGSGKSLLAKKISVALAQEGVSTIVVNGALHGEIFNSFIASIDEPAVVLFDEFEKVYNKEEQEAMLTLLDGVFTGKRLFLLTANDKWGIDKNMNNRPGRLFYNLDYKGLEEDAILEYCNERLNDKNEIKSILRLAKINGKFNFDMLQAMVEEMNRYNETAKEVLDMLNVSFGNQEYSYKILAEKDGRVYRETSHYGDIFNGEIDIFLQWNEKAEDVREGYWGHSESVILYPSNLSDINDDKYTYTYLSEEGVKVTFTRRGYASSLYTSAWV